MIWRVWHFLVSCSLGKIQHAIDRRGLVKARDIVALRESHRSAVIKNAKALVLLDALYRQPTVSVNKVAQTLSCTFPTAAKLVRDFTERGWLRELTGYERNRLWRYQPYVDLFHRETLDGMVGGAL